jgi:hypothetical protein
MHPTADTPAVIILRGAARRVIGGVMRLPKPLRHLLDFVLSVGLYVLVVVGGTVAFLCLAPVFGYLGYSDRPGPGWYGRFPAITWAEFVENARLMFGWAKLFVWHSFLFGSLIVLLARGLEWMRLERYAVASVCAGASIFFTGFLMLAAGWYISLGEAPFYFSILLAVLFGAVLLPKRRVAKPTDA